MKVVLTPLIEQCIRAVCDKKNRKITNITENHLEGYDSYLEVLEKAREEYEARVRAAKEKLEKSREMRDAIRSATKMIRSVEEEEQIDVEEVEIVGLPIEAVNSLVKYSRKLAESGDEQYKDFPRWFHEMMRGSRPFYPTEKAPPKDPKAQRRLEQLRAEYENRQYQRMVGRIITPNHIKTIQDSMEMKSSFSQLSVGINIIATMVTTFVGGYYVSNKMLGDEVLALCIGIICCIIGMMVDMWLYVINASHLERHIERQKKKSNKGSKIAPNYQGLVKYS